MYDLIILGGGPAGLTAAVAMKAIEQGIAGITDLTYQQEYENAKKLIDRARGLVQDAMATGYIEMPKGSKAPKPTKLARKAVEKATAKKAVPTKRATVKNGNGKAKVSKKAAVAGKVRVRK